MKSTIIYSFFLVLIFAACKDKKVDPPANVNLQKEAISDYSNHICNATYTELSKATMKLYNDIMILASQKTDANLTICRNDWKEARSHWENSEAWLFGPVATESIDPRIDTWPVDFIRLDSILNSSNTLDENYINSLEESLKGFHPIEYLLFGLNGQKAAADLTTRQLEYLTALALNLKNLTKSLSESWDPAYGNYAGELMNPGPGKEFADNKSVYIEMVNAMAGICDEVANGKIGEVFTNLDSMGEESPFAKNSITDFRSNIHGVRNVYYGTYNSKNVKGLEDVIREHNLSLDANIKLKIATALSALDQITDPFGKAIFTQPIQVQNAIDAINELGEILENDVMNLIELHIQ